MGLSMPDLFPGNVVQVYTGQGHWAIGVVLDGVLPDGRHRIQILDTGTIEWVWPSATKPREEDRHWHWQEQGICTQTNPDSFHPAEGGNNVRAKDVCRHQCPVRADCLCFALDNPVTGIWGGTSENERRRIKQTIRKINEEAS
jgi:WhiB family redox-sensing transcriptional regulator